MTLQTRAYIGAKYEQESSDYFYDWSIHSRFSEIPVIADATCTLATSITDTATSITVDLSGAINTDVPSVGGVWVAGNGTGQAWEYVQYSGVTSVDSNTVTLTGCNREPDADREHNGAHTAGAAVKFFWKLDTMAGEFSFIEEMDDEECIIDWSAEAHGWLFPQAALRDGHVFIYQYRTDVTAPFLTELVGFIDARNSEHDYKHADAWTVKIVSSAGMINRYRSRGLRRGDYNIARGATVQATDPLAAAWKERASGDYQAAEPTFDPSNTVDGETETLWIADAYYGTEPNHYQLSKESVATGDRVSLDDPSIRTSTDGSGKKLMMAEHIIITEIHLSAAVGQGGGYRYVELTCLDDFDALTDTNLYLATDNATNWYGLPVYTVYKNEKIIICENEDKFREENPSANPAQLIDLSKTDYYNFLKSLSTAGGTLALFYEFEATTSHFFHVVTWGTGGTAVINPPVGSYTSDLTFGTALAVATNGQTYRYNYASSATAANNWDVGYTQTAGYTLDNKAWMLVQLPPLGLKLVADLTDSYTGAVTLTDDTGETTAGLAASGEIQIGDERISYNSRGQNTITITARGNAGTTAAAHLKGDPVYVVVSDIAIDAFPIRTIELVRDGDIVISGYTLRTTSQTYPPRTPDEPNYTDDYEASVTVTGNTAQTITYNLATVRRIRWCLVEFNSLSESPARPRLNEFRALPSEDNFDTSTWMTTGATAGDLLEQILTNVGFNSSCYTINTTNESGKHGTADGSAWDVIKEFAAYSGLSVIVNRDSTITVNVNDYLIGDIFTIEHTWLKSNTVNLKALHAPPEPVSQIAVPWQSYDGATSGTAYYPSSPDATGNVFEMPEQVYASEADAQTRAQRIYYRKRFPYSWIAEAVQGVSGTRPGSIHSLSDWKLNRESGAIDRLCMVRSVDHMIQQDAKTHTLSWRTVVNLVEIQRTTAA